MKTDFWLDQIPLWGVFLLTVAVVLFSIGLGTLLGRLRRRQPDHEAEAPLGTIIGASLGLLAFMLAFTFGIAAELFQNRRQLLLNEVNTIGTTYLRAGLLMEPHQSQVRELLRQYVDIRVGLAKEILLPLPQRMKKLHEALVRSEALHDQMWSHAEALAKADRSSEIDAMFISSLNELIELHKSRVTVFKYRIPPVIWYVLYFITILSMVTVGYHVGLSGKSSLKMGVVLTLIFSAVMLLIVDLDRATEGHFQVSQQPMLELQKKMQMSAQEAEPKTKLSVPVDKPDTNSESPSTTKTADGN
jgi:multisubunit Na+/H+ antiporter MnhC subunit